MSSFVCVHVEGLSGELKSHREIHVILISLHTIGSCVTVWTVLLYIYIYFLNDLLCVNDLVNFSPCDFSFVFEKERFINYY